MSALTAADQAIASNVRIELARRNVKHGAVAKAIGMHPQAFSNRCRGITPSTAAQLLLIAAAIDCRAEDLFRLDEKASA